MKIRLVGAELFHADGKTDMKEPIVAFRYSANAPNNAAYPPPPKSGRHIPLGQYSSWVSYLIISHIGQVFYYLMQTVKESRIFTSHITMCIKRVMIFGQLVHPFKVGKQLIFILLFFYFFIFFPSCVYHA
jgi:hypothetical protein